MEESLFTFRTITAAQSAQQLLREQGITGRLTRAPTSLSSAGCGYGIWVRQPLVKAARTALQASKLQKQYRRLPDGRLEEEPL